MVQPQAPPSFHLLAKPTGSICNLDCAYCFFLSKELLYPGSRFRMADELLKTYLRQLVEAHRTPEVTVAWQGGEPTLMGLDFFKRSVDLARRYARPDQRIQHTIQTNGTLIDEEWAAFFKAQGFLVGLSIDGPRELHDAYRVDKGGRPTFDEVMRGLDCLLRHGVDWNALVTVHQANAEAPLAVYRLLRDKCRAEFIQFIPIVEREMQAAPLPLEMQSGREAPQPGPEGPRPGPAPEAGGDPALPRTAYIPAGTVRFGLGDDRPFYMQQGTQVTERSVTAEQYGRFLCAVFDEWLRRDVGRVFVQMFDVALASWHGEPHGLCVHSETCGLALALEHNGDLYSCDHFVEPAYRLGNIFDVPMAELVASEPQRRFGLDKRDRLPRHCRECELRFACHGGCPKDRFIDTPDGEPGLNYLCAGYKQFFHHVDRPMRIMSALLRQARAPAELMAILAREAGEAMPGSEQGGCL